jgi:DNA polymerase-3 subunit gamma/tau
MKEMINKYRPQNWGEVVGQRAACETIRSAIANKTSRAFLLTGDSGLGKTTIARLIAKQLGIDLESSGWREHDSAMKPGVDDVRELKELIQYAPLGGNGNQVVCMDEAHMLSKNSWNGLLKSVEEPPPGVYWVICTTEPNKVPKAIRTRCLEFQLAPVRDNDLGKLLRRVDDAEGSKLDSEVWDMLLEYAEGSPRQLLSGFAKVCGLKSVDDAEVVLQTLSAEGKEEVIDFCRALQKGANWKGLMHVLAKMENPNAEGIRLVVCAYFSKVAMGKTNIRDAGNSLALLTAFSEPYPTSGSSIHPVLVSLGKAFGD